MGEPAQDGIEGRQHGPEGGLGLGADQIAVRVAENLVLIGSQAAQREQRGQGAVQVPEDLLVCVGRGCLDGDRRPSGLPRVEQFPVQRVRSRVRLTLAPMRPVRLVGLDRLVDAALAAQGEHVQPTEVRPGGMGAQERVQIRRGLREVAVLQIQFGPGGAQVESEGAQADARGIGGGARDTVQGLAPPQVQGVLDEFASCRGLAVLPAEFRSGGELFALVHVDGARSRVQGVSTRGGGEDPGTEGVP